ncbi:MAG: AmmeMemoRadiSam system protein A [Planctomycetota bacterium]|nr:AmmeMemoRadiSam system protein A [Planctomycetota bacterium]
MARHAAARALGGAENLPAPPGDPALRQPAGCFVTFKRRDKPPGLGLRGCLGVMEAREPLWDAVARVAAESVTEDPRFAFERVTLDELPELHIDVSVLHPPRELRAPLDFELGADGIIVEGQGRWSGHRGVYLPQVAAEFGMSKEQFLASCCQSKAGLPAEAWRDAKLCKVRAFRAEVFGEP